MTAGSGSEICRAQIWTRFGGRAAASTALSFGSSDEAVTHSIVGRLTGARAGQPRASDHLKTFNLIKINKNRE